ncbi:hypothetical protein Bca4012_072074 [Brassica carinata]
MEKKWNPKPSFETNREEQFSRRKRKFLLQMGQLVRLVCGQWTKNDEGDWIFKEDPNEVEHFIVACTNQKFDAFLALVREELLLPSTKPVVLTYSLPDSMTERRTIKEPPHTILTDENVELLMSIQEWKNEGFMCVTDGPLGVAKYNFLCRSPFTIGDITYLAEGITEEEHFSVINGGWDDEIKCNGRVLRELFTEEKLALLYRYSFEIEKAKQTTQVNVKQSKHLSEDHLSNMIRGVDISNNDGEEIHKSKRFFNTERQGFRTKPIPAKRGNVQESSRRASSLEQYSEDVMFFSPTMGDMVGDTDYWETCGSGSCDNIINLSSELHFEDEQSPMSENEIVDIDGSSTGYTAAAEYVNAGEIHNTSK